jgi:hypothetical protein
MASKMDTLPNWTFSISEISAGLYRLEAKHALRASVELTGLDAKNFCWKQKNLREKSSRN